MSCAMNGIILPELRNITGLERGKRLIEVAKEHFTGKNHKEQNFNRLDNI